MKKPNTHPMAHLIRLILALAFVMAPGCGGKTPVVTFKVDAEVTANNGQPVYLVVRKVNSGDFIVQDYQSVAGMVMLNPPNDTVLATQLILPGQDAKLEFTRPDNWSLGVYCMFTQPGQWKIFLEKPLEDKYKLILEQNSIRLK